MKHLYQVSIVIPTRNRDEDLRELMHCIIRQTIPPIEVIVVDDSDTPKTKILVARLRGEFSDRQILLKHIWGKEENNSICAARNLGAKEATGEIVLFMDDDVLPAMDYIEKILEVYEGYPGAMGVQGNTNVFRSSVLGNAVNKIFFLFYTEKDRCRVHATGLSYPRPLTRIIRSRWLSGTNSSYKKEVLKDLEWDENLKGYSLFDDADISCRILRHYPNSLYTTPHAKSVHNFSPIARTETKKLIYINVTYSTYFFFKNMRQTPLNMIMFAWSMFFGRFISMIFGKNRRSILFLIGAYLHLIRNFGCVRNGNFDF